MRQIVLISGRICTGKSGLARRLSEEFCYRLVKTSKILTNESEKRGLTTDRLSLQALGDKLDEETKHRWVLDAVLTAGRNLKEDIPVVVDNIRTAQQLEQFRAARVGEIVHAHLYAPKTDLERRYKQKTPNLLVNHHPTIQKLIYSRTTVIFKNS
jgi:adenylosuccinate synthase